MAERPAEELLRRLGITEPKQIDLDAIAWHLGAAVRYRRMDSADATIIGSERRAVISVNSSRIETRQRFSLAHEIGHWQRHRGRILFCTPKDIGNPERSANDAERQADRYASDLILPPYLLRPRLENLQRLELAPLHKIAAEFNASMTATLLKIVAMNMFPIVVVCHRRSGRRWFRRSEMIPESWFPQYDLDAVSYAFAMLYRKSPEQSAPRKIRAGAWFDFRDADRYEIREQSFPLPNDEVLTVLTLPREAF